MILFIIALLTTTVFLTNLFYLVAFFLLLYILILIESYNCNKEQAETNSAKTLCLLLPPKPHIEETEIVLEVEPTVAYKPESFKRRASLELDIQFPLEDREDDISTEEPEDKDTVVEVAQQEVEDLNASIPRLYKTCSLNMLRKITAKLNSLLPFPIEGHYNKEEDTLREEIYSAMTENQISDQQLVELFKDSAPTVTRGLVSAINIHLPKAHRISGHNKMRNSEIIEQLNIALQVLGSL